MERRWFALLAVVVGVTGCAQMPSDLAKLGGWTSLIDGEAGLENWHRVGDANWRPEDGAIVAYRGKGGYLVSKNSYKDFQLRAEFWADPTTNSGIFLRVSNPKRIGANSAYEVDIADRPSTPALKPGGRWNTLEITARGERLVVMLNGVQTANIQNTKFVRGPLALEYGPRAKNSEGGPIKFRKVLVKTLDEPAKSTPASGGGSALR